MKHLNIFCSHPSICSTDLTFDLCLLDTRLNHMKLLLLVRLCTDHDMTISNDHVLIMTWLWSDQVSSDHVLIMEMTIFWTWKWPYVDHEIDHVLIMKWPCVTQVVLITKMPMRLSWNMNWPCYDREVTIWWIFQVWWTLWSKEKVLIGHLIQNNLLTLLHHWATFSIKQEVTHLHVHHLAQLMNLIQVSFVGANPATDFGIFS